MCTHEWASRESGKYNSTVLSIIESITVVHRSKHLTNRRLPSAVDVVLMIIYIYKGIEWQWEVWF